MTFFCHEAATTTVKPCAEQCEACNEEQCIGRRLDKMLGGTWMWEWTLDEESTRRAEASIR